VLSLLPPAWLHPASFTCPLPAVEEWDALERIWEYGLNAIHADASQHPLLVAEPAYSTTTQRERMAELLFESFRAPAMYLARSPVLSAFSMGRSSAVVVDIGACGTRVTPVHDGYILNSECRMRCLALQPRCGVDALRC